MSTKDYIALAAALNGVWCKEITSSEMHASIITFKACTDAIIEVLRANNNRFDSGLFRSAVYGKTTKGRDNGKNLE